MRDHTKEYAKPLVQTEIREKSWTWLLEEIRAEIEAESEAKVGQLTQDLVNAQKAYSELLSGVLANIEKDANGGQKES